VRRTAYASAAALRTLIKNLDDGGYSVNMVAHSLGNVAASEALLQEATSGDTNKEIVHTYVASQAAISAAAYDPHVLTDQRDNILKYASGGSAANELLNAAQHYGLPWNPDIYADFPTTRAGYFQQIGGTAQRMYNFFNPNDGAVADPVVWPLDQAKKAYTDGDEAGMAFYFNPADKRTYVSMYGRDFPLSIGGYGTPVETWAALAYTTGSRSTGLGASYDVAGPFTTSGQVNLSTAFGARSDNNFSSSRTDHSGEFMFDNMRRHMYWHLFMQRCGLSPIDDGTPQVGPADRP
jgi:hypothetical protein